MNHEYFVILFCSRVQFIVFYFYWRFNAYIIHVYIYEDRFMYCVVKLNAMLNFVNPVIKFSMWMAINNENRSSIQKSTEYKMLLRHITTNCNSNHINNDDTSIHYTMCRKLWEIMIKNTSIVNNGNGIVRRIEWWLLLRWTEYNVHCYGNDFSILQYKNVETIFPFLFRAFIILAHIHTIPPPSRPSISVRLSSNLW